MDDNTAKALAIGRSLVADVLTPMKQCFVGKDEIVDLLGLALVAGENLFLLGPPGTAKSALVKELARRIDGRGFDYLLTRFTEPSELFGPFDIRKLREGELATNTEGMLPEANLVFLDELLEVLAAVVDEALAAAQSANPHPRARASSTPDPEALASELEALSRRAASPGSSATATAQVRDQLGILAARCQWVQDETQRSWLQEQVAQIWKRVGSAP